MGVPDPIGYTIDITGKMKIADALIEELFGANFNGEGKLGTSEKTEHELRDFHVDAIRKIADRLETVKDAQIRDAVISTIGQNQKYTHYAPYLTQIYVLQDPANRMQIVGRVNNLLEAQRRNRGIPAGGGTLDSQIVRLGDAYVSSYGTAIRAEKNDIIDPKSRQGQLLEVQLNIAKENLDRLQRNVPSSAATMDEIQLRQNSVQESNIRLQALKDELAYEQSDDGKDALKRKIAQEVARLALAEINLANARKTQVTDTQVTQKTAVAANNVQLSNDQVETSEINLNILREKRAKAESQDEKDRIKVQIDSEITALARSKNALEIAKLQLEKLRQGPVGPTPEQREKISLQIKQARLSLKASTDQYNEWANDNQVAARDLGAQVQIAEARKILENIQEQSAGKKDIRATFQDVMGRWQEVIANIDPNDPDSWGQKDEATAGLVQGLMSAGGKTIATWEDAMALLGPLQSTLDRIESRERADERLRIEAEERARRIKLEDEAREAEKERIRKEEESLRLQEEGLGRTVESMTSMFAPGAVEVAPAPISAAPPPPPAAPVEGVASDEDVSAEVNKLLGISGGGGNPPIGIQEVLDKYNGTGGGDPYHESEELDLDGSDNNGEEVIIEEISFMPPHPIKKFAPPVASGAPPIIINIGTGGFTPPII